MDKRPILLGLIERLRPEVGHIGWSDFAFYGDEEPAVTREARLWGALFLAKALLTAEEALASDHEGTIEMAAMFCPGLERQGRAIAERYRTSLMAQEVSRRRQAGADARGLAQTEAAAEFWQPYQRKYAQLRTAGRSRVEAGRSIKYLIRREKVVLPGTGKPPSDRTISDWLKKTEVTLS